MNLKNSNTIQFYIGQILFSSSREIKELKKIEENDMKQLHARFFHSPSEALV